MLLAIILNFGVWGAGTLALHGDAINGKVENNRYFLNWKGQYTEVTRERYLYSLIHTWVTIGTFPAVIVLLGIESFIRKGTAKDRKKSASRS